MTAGHDPSGLPSRRWPKLGVCHPNLRFHIIQEACEWKRQMVLPLIVASPKVIRLPDSCGGKRERLAKLVEIQRQLNALENATKDYCQLGVQILELANSAYGLYLRQEWTEKAKLLKSLLSNSTFVHGTLYSTYKKPFDILAKGSEFESWRPRPHSPQTFVNFLFPIRLHYTQIGGSRWKTIGCRSFRPHSKIHPSSSSQFARHPRQAVGAPQIQGRTGLKVEAVSGRQES